MAMVLSTQGGQFAGSGSGLVPPTTGMIMDSANEGGQLDSSSYLDLATADIPFSVHFWLKTSVSGAQIIMHKRLTAGSARPWNEKGYQIHQNSNNKLEIYLIHTHDYNHRFLVEFDQVINDGLLNHFAITYDGLATTGSAKCYMNGSLLSGTEVINGLANWRNINSSAKVNFGRGNDQESPLNGAMADYKMFEGEVLPNGSGTLMAHYPMSSDLLDISGNDRHGTIYAGTTFGAI